MIKKRSVFIDNNVFDKFVDKGFCLCHYLPSDRYSLCVNRQVDFEIRAIPDNKDKQKLKAFISKCKNCCVQERAILGFFNPNLPNNEQRVGNFHDGQFADESEEEFRRELCDKFYGKKREELKPVKKSRLYPDEADIDLAARSMHSIVISYDEKKNKKPGPLNYAKKKGYHVVFLNDFKIETNLEAFILNQL